MATPYTALTDAEKLIAEPSGLYPSGEAHFFDAEVQGIEQGTKKFISPTDDGTFIDPVTNNLHAEQSGYLYGGGINNGNDEESSDFVLQPSGLIFELQNNEGENVLSSSDTYKKRNHSGAFGPINAGYIFYTPIPGGGSGLMDKTATFVEYTPNQSGNVYDGGGYIYGTPPTYTQPATSGEDTITISSGNSP